MNNIRGLIQNNEGRHPGYCLNHRTNLCKTRKDNVCDKCTKQISEILKINHLKMSLENRCKLNQRQQFEYFFNNELWRKSLYKNYTPRTQNILSTRKNLSKFKSSELELGHIYEVFDKFIEEMIKKYRVEHGLSATEVDGFLKSFFKSDSIGDFVNYNILDRNLSFNIVSEEDIQNTSFETYQEELESIIGSTKISDLKLSIKENETTEDKTIPINFIPEFYIKTVNYKSLVDQITHVLKEIEDGNSKIKPEIPPTEENIEIIKKYIKIVKFIEGISKSSKHIADSYITDILKKRSENLIKIGIIKDNIKIANNKNPNRATEKIIKDYDGNLHKLKDISRFSISFDTQLDLVNGAIEIIEMLDKYNKTEEDSQKQIIDISFESKFGYSRNTSIKNSGYRDAKLLVKIGNGNVIEIQLHISSLLESKYQGINTARNKKLTEIIKLLNFSKEEIQEINTIIDMIDRDGSYKIKPQYFDKMTESDLLSSDQIYSIYRLLSNYDRDTHTKPKKELSERSLLEKLQYLEKEINHEGYRKMIDLMFGFFSEKAQRPKREKIISKLKPKQKNE